MTTKKELDMSTTMNVQQRECYHFWHKLRRANIHDGIKLGFFGKTEKEILANVEKYNEYQNKFINSEVESLKTTRSNKL